MTITNTHAPSIISAYNPPWIEKDEMMSVTVFIRPHTKGNQVDILKAPALNIAPSLQSVSQHGLA